MANDTFINWWSAKEIGQYGNINISFNYDKLAEYVNEKWFINMTIKKRKEVWQYWETHSIVLNTFVPDSNKKKANKNDADDIFPPF